MAKQGNMVRYTTEELKAAIARGEDRTDRVKVAAQTEAEIEAHAAEDDAEFPVDWSEAEVLIGLPPMKTAVNLRIDSDVLDWFKQSGKGYQTRMNKVLRAFFKAASGGTPSR